MLQLKLKMLPSLLTLLPSLLTILPSKRQHSSSNGKIGLMPTPSTIGLTMTPTKDS
jgi:hypothetical protein